MWLNWFCQTVSAYSEAVYTSKQDVSTHVVIVVAGASTEDDDVARRPVEELLGAGSPAKYARILPVEVLEFVTEPLIEHVLFW